jgi:hypothetical protein
MGVGLDVLNDVALSIPYHTIVRCSFSDCERGVHIASPNVTVMDCGFSDVEIGILVDDVVSIKLRADPAGIAISECQFEGCGHGIMATNASEMRIVSNEFVDCATDIGLMAARSVSETGNVHCRWEDAALVLVSSEIATYMSSFEDGPAALMADQASTASFAQCRIARVAKTVIINGGSSVYLHNSTHVKDYSVDQTSRLVVSWDVRVTAVLESGSTGGHALLIATDVEGDIVLERHAELNRSTGPSGIVELRIYAGIASTRNPHVFSASFAGVLESVTSVIDRYVEIRMVLDDVPPEIWVVSPLMAMTNLSIVRLAGHAKDNTSLPVTIVISVDGSKVMETEGCWDMLLPLAEGDHLLEYECLDAKGNSRTMTSRLRVDTVPPDLVILEPPDAVTTVSAREVRIRGTVIGQVQLTINGQVVEPRLLEFDTSWQLPEDGSFWFTVMAWDELRNTVETRLQVNRDTTPPSVVLDELASILRDPEIMVRGFVSDDAVSVRVGAASADIMPDRRFASIFPLVEGLNLIEITVTDRAGNRAVLARSVTRDISTRIRIVSPLDGTVFQVDEIDIVVEAEPGSTVVVNGMEELHTDETGIAMATILLLSNETRVVVKARDILGNEAEAEVTILYKPPPPVVREAPIWPVWLAIIMMLVLPVPIIVYGRGRPDRPGRT